MSILIDNNNLKIKFNEKTKKLIFVDNKGYTYDIKFDEKGSILDNTNDSKIKKQMNQISNILDSIQQSGRIGPDGPPGPSGPPGPKGPPGDGLKIDYIEDSIAKINVLENVKEGESALIKEKMDLYIRINNQWVLSGNLKGKQGDIGPIGLKGDKGDGLIIDVVVEDESKLLEQPENIKFALIKNSLNLYYKSNIWTKIGNLKGPEGKTGKTGSKGPKGDGIKIDYIYESQSKLIQDELEPKKNDVVLISETGDLIIWKDKWKKLGKLNLKLTNSYRETLVGGVLKPVNKIYEDISIKQLRLVSFNKGDNSLLSIKEDKIILSNRGEYKIKYNICWNASGENLSMFLRSGILVFVYNKGKLVENSIKFGKGFPYVNSCSHEFLLENESICELEFIIHVIDLTSSIQFSLFEEGCYLDIEKI